MIQFRLGSSLLSPAPPPSHPLSCILIASYLAVVVYRHLKVTAKKQTSALVFKGKIKSSLICESVEFTFYARIIITVMFISAGMTIGDGCHVWGLAPWLDLALVLSAVLALQYIGNLSCGS